MIQVAIQGIRGSYSEEAALALVSEAAIIECEDFAATFEAVRVGRADYAVVPVENKITGDIEGSKSILRGGDFREHERLPLKVQHVLAGIRDADIGDIDRVRSHVEALKQCRNYLVTRGWAQEIGADTASSIRRVVENGDIHVAAIGNRRAAEFYGAKIIAEEIADDRDNWTTFCLISGK